MNSVEISASITFPLNKIGSALLRAAADSVDASVEATLNGGTIVVPATRVGAEAAPAKKRGRPSKADQAAKAAAEPEAEETTEDEFDFGDDEPEAEEESTEDTDDEAEAEEPAPKKKAAKTAPAKRALSLEKDIIPACQGDRTRTLSLERDIIPACQGDRTRAQKLLAKQGLKSVRDLPADKYESFLKAMLA